jgi:hypothetical protein
VFVSERPWQLFGLSLPKEGRDDQTASYDLFGPGPEPVCRARPVDSTTADKIQGPGPNTPVLPFLPFCANLISSETGLGILKPSSTPMGVIRDTCLNDAHKGRYRSWKSAWIGTLGHPPKYAKNATNAKARFANPTSYWNSGLIDSHPMRWASLWWKRKCLTKAKSPTRSTAVRVTIERLTTVGYGATGFDIGRESPLAPEPVYQDSRYRATVRLLSTNEAVGDQFVKTTGVSLTGDKGEASCSGDSGGPLFVPDQQTIVGVFSITSTPVCRGPAFYQRMDLPAVLKWVRSFP